MKRSEIERLKEIRDRINKGVTQIVSGAEARQTLKGAATILSAIIADAESEIDRINADRRDEFRSFGGSGFGGCTVT